MSNIKGFDISEWQGKISVDNFKKSKAAGYSFVIIRIGYTGTSTGSINIDSCFENNWKNAVAAGLKVGGYWYSGATSTTKVAEEVEAIKKALKGKKPTYPIYLDVEENANIGKVSKDKVAAICDKYCTLIAAAGYKPGIYANLSWFNTKIGTIKEAHTKWVAQYYSKDEYKFAHDMWQHSSTTAVPGIGSKIDVNIAYKDLTVAHKSISTVVVKKTYLEVYPKLDFNWVTLSYGSVGSQVYYLQRFLNWALNSKLALDKSFGPKTLAAVKQFQKLNKLVVDGIVGPKTRAAMKVFKK